MAAKFSLVVLVAGFAGDSVGQLEKLIALDNQQEKLVRNSIYGRPSRTSFDIDNLREVLLIPEELSELFKKQPEAVLNLLVQIVEGANPNDSSLAAGYAMELVHGPGRGVVCVNYYDEKTYDSIHRGWGTAFRAHWIKKLRSDSKK